MAARALALRGWKTLFLGEFTLASARHAAAWAREHRRSDGRVLDEPCRARPRWAFLGDHASPQIQRRWLRAEGRPATYPEFVRALTASGVGAEEGDAAVSAAGEWYAAPWATWS
eukprot:8308818-Alexandrium_andersonii.AAC.1